MKNSEIEILAPAGDGEMLAAAVRSGADAVYLGLKQFNARRNAANFSSAALKKAVDYCHRFSVKVYLTFNILISDGEMEEALETVKEAYLSGADALIVTDLGLISEIHKAFPDFPLHASTQLTVHSPSALPFLKELGIKRVVVSREMSKAELKAICKEAERLNMSVEVFVHGALCMSMSGQCLLSAVLGGRSGNRGLCAGPCRLPFLSENGTGYDLSLKDLSLMDYIGELKDMGVASLKIEGRMKRPEYVAAAVKTAVSVRENGKADLYISEYLKNVFSRSGFTSGYYSGNLNRDMFGIRTKEDVTDSMSVLSKIRELYKKEPQNTPVSAYLTVKSGEKAVLSLSDGENTAEVSGFVPEVSETKPLDEISAKEQISKLGSTPFYLEKFESDIENGLFMRASALNDMRREAAEKLLRIRTKNDRKSDFKFEKMSSDKVFRTPKTVVRVTDISRLPESEDIFAVIFPYEKEYKKEDLPDALLIAELPRGIINEENMLSKLKSLKELGFTYAAVGNVAEIPLVKAAGLGLLFGFGMNVFNSYSVSVAENVGAKAALLSPELTLKSISEINSAVPLAVISYGRLPLMLTRNCPVRNGKSCNECDKKGSITDRKGVSFPVRCREGYSEILNSVPIWLGDKKENINADFSVFYFTDEEKDEAEEVLHRYSSSLPAPSDFTRGLYFRGVE